MSAHNTPKQLHEADYAIPDPGTGEAIIVDRWGGTCPLVIAAGETETNTLASPTSIGQRVKIFAQTVGSGGTRAVTAPVGFDQAGSTVMTFTALYDMEILESIETATAGTFIWFRRVDGNSTIT